MSLVCIVPFFPPSHMRLLVAVYVYVTDLTSCCLWYWQVFKSRK